MFIWTPGGTTQLYLRPRQARGACPICHSRHAAGARFDDIVELAAYICDTPVALVSFVSHDRQWFKARFGLSECQTDLNSSVCQHALIEPDLLVVGDLSLDERTRANPLVVSAPFIRFYAGAPLRTAEGHVLGSLCVIDTKARPGGLTAAHASALRNLGHQVVGQLEMRRAVSQRDARRPNRSRRPRAVSASCMSAINFAMRERSERSRARPP